MSKQNMLSFLGALSSKMCHDLVAPLSAVRMGLELIEDKLSKELLEDPAFLLIQDNLTKTMERIDFFRYAYAFSKTEYVPKREEFLKVCEHACFYYKINFVLEAFDLPEYEQASHLRLITCFLYLLIDTLPKGGEIRMSITQSVTQIQSKGPIILVNTSLDQILGRDRLDKISPQSVLPELIKAGLTEFHLSLELDQTPERIKASFISKFLK